MGKINGRSGGGIEGRNVVNTQNPKQHVRPHGVSVGATSRLGNMVAVGTPHKALLNEVAYTNPTGPIPVVGANCRPGGGREVLRAGSQSKTPPAIDPARSKPHW
jgi:hypothetical protein